VVNAIIEALGFRHIAVHRDEYAVSRDGNKMLELDQTFAGCRFALVLRNSHDKSMRLVPASTSCAPAPRPHGLRATRDSERSTADRFERLFGCMASCLAKHVARGTKPFE